MTPREAKLKAGREWAILANFKDARSFLGFANK